MYALIIDDSRAMRKILGRIMQSQGFHVFEAGDGQEGLDLLRDHSDVNVVLVDWNMPHMDGLEFVKKVRAHAKHAATRLVMVTTETEAGQMARALMSGVDEFVMKPFTADILIDKLRLIGVSVGQPAC